MAFQINEGSNGMEQGRGEEDIVIDVVENLVFLASDEQIEENGEEKEREEGIVMDVVENLVSLASDEQIEESGEEKKREEDSVNLEESDGNRKKVNRKRRGDCLENFSHWFRAKRQINITQQIISKWAEIGVHDIPQSTSLLIRFKTLKTMEIRGQALRAVSAEKVELIKGVIAQVQNNSFVTSTKIVVLMSTERCSKQMIVCNGNHRIAAIVSSNLNECVVYIDVLTIEHSIFSELFEVYRPLQGDTNIERKVARSVFCEFMLSIHMGETRDKEMSNFTIEEEARSILSVIDAVMGGRQKVFKLLSTQYGRVYKAMKRLALPVNYVASEDIALLLACDESVCIHTLKLIRCNRAKFSTQRTGSVIAKLFARNEPKRDEIRQIFTDYCNRKLESQKCGTQSDLKESIRKICEEKEVNEVDETTDVTTPIVNENLEAVRSSVMVVEENEQTASIERTKTNDEDGKIAVEEAIEPNSVDRGNEADEEPTPNETDVKVILTLTDESEIRFVKRNIRKNWVLLKCGDVRLFAKLCNELREKYIRKLKKETVVLANENNDVEVVYEFSSNRTMQILHEKKCLNQWIEEGFIVLN